MPILEFHSIILLFFNRSQYYRRRGYLGFRGKSRHTHELSEERCHLVMTAHEHRLAASRPNQQLSLIQSPLHRLSALRYRRIIAMTLKVNGNRTASGIVCALHEVCRLEGIAVAMAVSSRSLYSNEPCAVAVTMASGLTAAVSRAWSDVIRRSSAVFPFFAPPWH